ncbi:MAG: MerC family mercury resistance protein [Chthoniobacterales bacterium]|nr:MerC family mercury resistance protein [Chthoniobacterales bacterium]
MASIAAPCCFPVFAAASAAVGLSAIGRYETAVLYFFQGFAALALIGLLLAAREHRRRGPVALGFISASILAYAFYVSMSQPALYLGLAGLLVATIWNRLIAAKRNKCADPVLKSVITCPECGNSSEETMPTNACLFYYDCAQCGAKLKPKSGDCCVFCSYGSVPCPPIQAGETCCA